MFHILYSSMKTFATCALFLLAMTMSSSLFAQKGATPSTNLKIGFVDTEVILKQLPEALEGDKRIKDIVGKINDTLKTMNQQLTERYEKYQKQSAMMTAESKAQEEAALKAMQQNMLLYQEEKLGQTGEVARIREQLIGPLREKISKGIQDVAKQEGLHFVLDKANPGLLYAEDKFDITFTVLDKIKRGK